jgi:hypothetical protein
VVALPAKQEAALLLVDERLARVYRRAFQKLRGMCRFDGARSLAEQLGHIASGKSKLKNPYNSKHVIGARRAKAEAIDVYPTVPGTDLGDPHSYSHVVSAMKEAALEEGVNIFNGGEAWGWDWPHWQLK